MNHEDVVKSFVGGKREWKKCEGPPRFTREGGEGRACLTKRQFERFMETKFQNPGKKD